MAIFKTDSPLIKTSIEHAKSLYTRNYKSFEKGLPDIQNLLGDVSVKLKYDESTYFRTLIPKKTHMTVGKNVSLISYRQKTGSVT